MPTADHPVKPPSPRRADSPLPPSDNPSPETPTLELHLTRLGEALATRLARVVAAIPGSPVGPVKLAKAIGMDKVLASRVLRASAHRNPIAALKAMPGPEPLRRLSQAAKRRGVDPALIKDLDASVADFDLLLRRDVGDRSALDTILASWLPESRAEFELSRKQGVYRSISQLRGTSADVMINTVFVTPTPNDPSHIDLNWVIGMLGLRRVRPGAVIKFASRRIVKDPATDLPRSLLSLDATPAHDIAGLILPQFCSKPIPEVTVRPAGEVVHYLVRDHGFGVGPNASVDLVFGEVSRRELSRLPTPPTRPGRGTQLFVFAEVNTPTKRLLFDVFIHKDLAPKSGELSLHVYDTAFEGSASPNDPARNLDRLDLLESITPLGPALRQTRAANIPWYEEMLATTAQKLALPPNDLLGWRVEIEYPIYGSQVTLGWDSPEEPTPSSH